MQKGGNFGKRDALPEYQTSPVIAKRKQRNFEEYGFKVSLLLERKQQKKGRSSKFGIGGNWS